jgi:hypothetical protein
VRLLSTLGRPWPTVSDANAFARSRAGERAGVLRSREEEEKENNDIALHDSAAEWLSSHRHYATL